MVPLPVISPHYALRSLSSVASIPHAARLSYHWTADAVNWLNFHRTGGSTCSGQGAHAPPDRRLRRIGIFKITQTDRIMLSSCPERLIVLKIDREGNIWEIYNGPGDKPWELSGKKQKNGQRAISLRKLESIDKEESSSGL